MCVFIFKGKYLICQLKQQSIILWNALIYQMHSMPCINISLHEYDIHSNSSGLCNSTAECACVFASVCVLLCACFSVILPSYEAAGVWNSVCIDWGKSTVTLLQPGCKQRTWSVSEVAANTVHSSRLHILTTSPLLLTANL